MASVKYYWACDVCDCKTDHKKCFLIFSADGRKFKDPYARVLQEGDVWKCVFCLHPARNHHYKIGKLEKP